MKGRGVAGVVRRGPMGAITTKLRLGQPLASSGPTNQGASMRRTASRIESINAVANQRAREGLWLAGSVGVLIGDSAWP
jgi:uridine phosphorylase